LSKCPGGSAAEPKPSASDRRPGGPSLGRFRVHAPALLSAGISRLHPIAQEKGKVANDRKSKSNLSNKSILMMGVMTNTDLSRLLRIFMLWSTSTEMVAHCGTGTGQETGRRTVTISNSSYFHLT
jgi:hypothetical protein